MEPTESGLGHDIWAKPPFGTIGVFSNNFVSTRAFVYAKLELYDGGWNGKRDIDNSS